MRNVALYEEALRRFSFERTEDKSADAYTYKFFDGQGNEYIVHFLPINGRPGCYDLEYLTQHMDYMAMTAGFIPFSISNMVFGDILSDFADDPGFREVVVSPVDERRGALYMRTIRSRFPGPEWVITENEVGDITLART